MIKIPEISVLLSVYNAQKTIKQSVQSILDQTFENFEFLIINDGSTDGTKDILHSFEDPRIHIIHKKNQGLANALNMGLQHCRGSLIARMDADDYSYPDRLLLQKQFLDGHPEIDIVSCQVEYGGNREENEGYALHVDWINSVKTLDQIYLKRFQDSPIANPSTMFRKNLVEQFGEYDNGSLPEDYEFWLRMMQHGVRIGKVNQTLLRWNDSPQRLTRNHENYSNQRFYEVKANYFFKWLETSHQIPTSVYVFGTGKFVNSKLKPFINLGLKVHKFIEVKQPPYQHNNIIHYTALPNPGSHLVLSFVSDRKGKLEVEKFLNSKQYVEGKDFLMMT